MGFSGMDIRRATLASPGVARCVKAGGQRVTHGRRPHLALAQKPDDKFFKKRRAAFPDKILASRRSELQTTQGAGKRLTGRGRRRSLCPREMSQRETKS